MPRRSALAVLGLLVAMAVSSAPASACNDPHLQAVEPATASPGDDVTYTIVYTSPGATYAVTINGEYAVDSGTADGAYVTRSFKMPDLGSTATRVSVQAVVTHDDIEGGSIPSSQTIQYEPRAASPESNAAPEQPAPADSGPTAEPQPAAAPAPPGPTSGAGPVAPPPPRSDKPAGPKPRTPAPRSPVHKPTSAPVPSRTAARAGSRTPAPALPATAGAPLTRVIATGQAAKRAHIAARTRTHTRAHAPSVAPAVRVRLPLDRGVVDDTTVAVAVAILVGLLGGIGRIGVRALWRAPLPTLPKASTAPDAVEVELQEIIAEERARDVTRSGVP